jgi:hypothetical protein
VSADLDADDDGIADEDEVQNVNIVSAAPDPSASSGQALDRDGREDKYETTQARPVEPRTSANSIDSSTSAPPRWASMD